MKIAICDDNYIEIEYLNSLVSRWLTGTGIQAHIATFDSAESFLFHYEDDKGFDILLLDIQMKEINGIELARIVRANDDGIAQIVFITGISDYMAEGYDVAALHYLIKPVEEEKLFEVLDKALKNLEKPDKSLFLTVDGEMQRIPFFNIVYIEAQGHYIMIHTAQQMFKAKMNLSEIMADLDKGFFRCQRSFIVNLRYICKVSRKVIILEDNTEIPLSRNLYDDANRAIIEFFS